MQTPSSGFCFGSVFAPGERMQFSAGEQNSALHLELWANVGATNMVSVACKNTGKRWRFFNWHQLLVTETLVTSQLTCLSLLQAYWCIHCPHGCLVTAEPQFMSKICGKKSECLQLSIILSISNNLSILYQYYCASLNHKSPFCTSSAKGLGFNMLTCSILVSCL